MKSNEVDVSGVQGRAAHGRLVAVLTAAVILLPAAGYLVVHYGFSKEDPITSQPQVLLRSSETSNSKSIEEQINLSLEYIRSNQPGRAVPLLDAILTEDPKNAVALNNRCFAHTMLMLYDLGMQDCRRALGIQPDFQLAKNNLKWAEDEYNQTLRRIAQQEQIPENSRDGAFYLAEGLNLLHVGRYDKAIAAWQHALSIHANDALAANNVGTAYMFKGEPCTALTRFQKASAMDSTLQVARNNIAWAQDELSMAHSPAEKNCR